MSGVRRAGVLIGVLALCAACSGSRSKRLLPSPTTTTTTVSTTSTSTSSTTVPGSTTTTARPGATTTSTTAKVARPTTTTTRRAAQTVTFTEADNGTQVSGVVGDTFKVQLQACGGCGYRWVVSGVPAKDTVRYDDEQDSSPPTTTVPGTTSSSSPAVGTPVVQTFTFTAVGAHTTGLVIGYYPPSSSTASRNFTLTFHIAP